MFLLQDPRIVTDLNVFRKEVLDRINQGEAKWKESWTRELDGVKVCVFVCKRKKR